MPEPQLLRQFSALGSANIVAAVTSFVSLAVVAHTITVDEFGRLVFARSATAAAFAFLDPRLEDALQRFMPIVHRDHGGGATSRLFERVVWLDQGVNLLLGTVGVTLLATGFVSGGGIADPSLLAPATVQMAAQGPVGTLSAGYALTDGLAPWGVLQSGSAVAFTAASLVGLAAGGARGFLIGGAVAALLTTLVLWFMTVRRTRRAYGPPSHMPQALPRGFVWFTFRAAANSSLLIGSEALPLTVIGLRANASTLASFRVALSPARLAEALVSPVGAIVYPRASRASAARRATNAAADALAFTRRVVPVAAVLLLIGGVAMPFAITVAFGSSFRGASTTATVLLAAALVRGTVAWSKTLPLALGDATRRVVVSMLDISALITVAALLANTTNALGVAIGYLVIAVVVSGYWLRYARGLKRNSGE